MQRKTTLLRPALLWIVLLALVGAACAPAGPGGSSGGADRPAATSKRIKAIINSDPIGLQKGNPPGGAGQPGHAQLADLLIAGMTTTDAASVLRPRLAEAVPTVENGLWRVLSDGTMETEWRIRTGARWHDGTPITAADFAFTAQVDQDRELAASRDVAYDSLAGIRTNGPDGADTVIAAWKQPFIDADKLFKSPMPKHLVEPLYEDKATMMAQPFWTREFVGSGPFRVKEWVPSSHLIISAFDGYVLGRPNIDEIELRFIIDTARSQPTSWPAKAT